MQTRLENKVLRINSNMDNFKKDKLSVNKDTVAIKNSIQLYSYNEAAAIKNANMYKYNATTNFGSLNTPTSIEIAPSKKNLKSTNSKISKTELVLGLEAVKKALDSVPEEKRKCEEYKFLNAGLKSLEAELALDQVPNKKHSPLRVQQRNVEGSSEHEHKEVQFKGVWEWMFGEDPEDEEANSAIHLHTGFAAGIATFFHLVPGADIPFLQLNEILMAGSLASVYMPGESEMMQCLVGACMGVNAATSATNMGVKSLQWLASNTSLAIDVGTMVPYAGAAVTATLAAGVTQAVGRSIKDSYRNGEHEIFRQAFEDTGTVLNKTWTGKLSINADKLCKFGDKVANIDWGKIANDITILKIPVVCNTKEKQEAATRIAEKVSSIMQVLHEED
ncbi:MAG: hypothetical protein WCK67_01160 [bacterium]